ncbi:hypothetical protein [Nitrospirillum sp. BR 11828]|uniref:hypothetical protein n=1 Tax=Nitrospirillum sp. BR 11828 TaxID=3104325 RepID=UPI002ACA6BE1|nr:hypothetical protein [Nitrospirillum sp. BR 11828]MDZ5647763.1 hypothetical protein [Nitrospirillum sp. BR 11828]
MRWPPSLGGRLPPWRKRWLWALPLIGVVIGGAILAGRLFLPATAERRLAAALVEVGFPQAQVTVRHAGWGWLEAGVRLQPGLEADTALVTFTGLLPWGTPARLALTGVSVDAGLVDGQALGRLMDMPIDHVEIGAAQVVHGDWSVPLALNATLDRQGGESAPAGWQGQAVLEPGDGWPAFALTLRLSKTQNGPALTVDPAPGAGPQLSGTLATSANTTTKADLTVKGLRVRDWPGPLAGHLTGQVVGWGDSARWTISATVDTPDAHLALDGTRPWVGDSRPGGLPAAPWGLVLKARGAGSWGGEGRLTLTGTAETGNGEGRTLALALSAEGVTAPQLPLMASFLSLTATATPQGDGAWTLALTGPAQAGGRLRDGQGTPVSLGWDPGADGHLAVTWRGGLGKERRGHADMQGAVVGRLGPASAPWSPAAPRTCAPSPTGTPVA